jgi:hypothetical protein
MGTYAAVIEVKPMEDGDALALLQKKLDFHADADIDPEKAKELLQALDRMPLATCRGVETAHMQEGLND